MKGTILLSCALVSALFSGALAQEFPIGIWFSGNQNAIDSVSAMNFTWIHGYGGWNRFDSPTYNYILNNNRNLKVIAILERNINTPFFTQWME